MAPSPSPPISNPPPTVSSEQFASNVDTELNKRGLSLRGDDRVKLARLRRGIKREKGKEVSETGEVKYKKEFKYFPKLPLELRRMIWKRAIPVFPHRVITVKEIWGTGEGNSSEYTQTITYPSHPGAYLIVTCKEFKQVLEEQCFAHLRTIAKDAAITKEDEVLVAVDSKKQAVTYSASRLVDCEDDILYLTVGLDFFTVPEHKILVPFASIKRLMMPHDRFIAMLVRGDLKYEIILQTLTALEQILVIDFPELTLPSGYMEHVSGPHRIYTVADQLEFFPWFSLDPPRSIEPFHGSQYDDDLCAQFREWLLDTLNEGGSGPLRGVAFDEQAFSNFLDVKVYYYDASKRRVGPNLLVQDQDRYEFSRVDRKWYSTSTGLAAVLDNEDY